MCGIGGFIGSENNKKEILKNMMDRIAHRGPDAEGYYIKNDVALGQRRLSIIDLKNGKQPMYSNDKNLVIVFNGEIYNYKELKEEIKDYDFKTTSDTEVILAGYKKWGKKIVDKLRGMWSFVIYDESNNTLFASRDPFGIKPFYYYFNEETKTLMFASEIKAFMDHPSFKKEFNESILSAYMSFSFTPTNETFFKGVKRLDAGSNLIYKNGNLKIEKYYNLKFDIKKDDYNKTVEKIAKTMEDSVNHHMIADVEVGSFLSSGVDSSYLVSLAKPNKTYTVGYEDKNYDETSYAKDLSKKLGIQNKDKVITKKEYMNVLDKIMYYMDEPASDPAIVALYFVSELASKDVKVVLSGEGADEFFGGYNYYRQMCDCDLYNKIPFCIRHAIAKVAEILPPIKGINFLVRRGEKLEDSYIGVNRVWHDRELKHILKVPVTIKNKDITKPIYDEYKDESELVKMQAIDINFWLIKDILQKADRMTMANSLEGRVPFVDKEVFNIASSLPLEYKVTKANTKVALRDAAKKAIPTEAYKKKKLGFPVPVRAWMREDYVYNIMKKEFESDIANEFFNSKVLLKMLEEHKNNKKDNYRKLWNIFTFLKWYNVFFKEDKVKTY